MCMVLFVASTFTTVSVRCSGQTQETASDNGEFNHFHSRPSFFSGCRKWTIALLRPIHGPALSLKACDALVKFFIDVCPYMTSMPSLRLID